MVLKRCLLGKMKLLVTMAGVYCFILNSVISFRERMRRLQEAETRLLHSNRDQPAKFSSDFGFTLSVRRRGVLCTSRIGDDLLCIRLTALHEKYIICHWQHGSKQKSYLQLCFFFSQIDLMFSPLWLQRENMLCWFLVNQRNDWRKRRRLHLCLFFHELKHGR